MRAESIEDEGGETVPEHGGKKEAHEMKRNGDEVDKMETGVEEETVV